MNQTVLFIKGIVNSEYLIYRSLILIVDFDLEKERSVLDEQGLKIAENQENSQKNRRKLAESTRGNMSGIRNIELNVLILSDADTVYVIYIRTLSAM